MRTRIFNHRRDRPRQVPVAGAPLEVSEGFYSCGLSLTQVAYNAINRAYPKNERDQNPKVLDTHAESSAQAKQFLTYYKCIVRDEVVPLAKLKKHKEPYDYHPSDFAVEISDRTKKFEDRPTYEFRCLVVLNNFHMLYLRLRDYAPLLLPPEHVEAYLKVLETTFLREREQLLEFLSRYEADPVKTAEDFE